MQAVTETLRQLLEGAFWQHEDLTCAGRPAQMGAVMWRTKRIVCLTYSGSMVGT